MRTLATQMRLRRLIRQASELVPRLRSAPGDADAAAAAARRLAGLVADVQEAWTADCAAAGPANAADLTVFDAHVRRGLRALQGVIAELSRPGADLEWLSGRFRAVALPLVLFLRGLEEAPADLLGTSGPALGKTA